MKVNEYKLNTRNFVMSGLSSAIAQKGWKGKTASLHKLNISLLLETSINYEDINVTNKLLRINYITLI